MQDPLCPCCDADVPMDGEVDSGELVFCPLCSVPLRVKLVDEKWEIAEEY